MLDIEKKPEKTLKAYWLERENIDFVIKMAKKNKVSLSAVVNSIIKSIREAKP